MLAENKNSTPDPEIPDSKLVWKCESIPFKNSDGDIVIEDRYRFQKGGVISYIGKGYQGLIFEPGVLLADSDGEVAFSSEGEAAMGEIERYTTDPTFIEMIRHVIGSRN